MFYYKNISALFTGDIEKVAEEALLKKYDTYILNATILKVAHHGSKSSSIQPFLDRVQPEVALIGVGEKNKFGHPNTAVIERLENIGASIFRTDKDGEISITVDRWGKYGIKKCIR